MLTGLVTVQLLVYQRQASTFVPFSVSADRILQHMLRYGKGMVALERRSCHWQERIYSDFRERTSATPL